MARRARCCHGDARGRDVLAFRLPPSSTGRKPGTLPGWRLILSGNRKGSDVQYPSDFPVQSQARVEAEKIRAAREFQSAKAADHWTSDVRAHLLDYILTVFLAFADEARALRLWPVAKMDSQCREFLRRLTIEARYEKGPGVGEMNSNWNGSILSEVQRELEKTSKWQRYQDFLLDLADAQSELQITQKDAAEDKRTHPGPPADLAQTGKPRGTWRMNTSTPLQIPGELVNGFPSALKSQVEVILTEARREFQGKNPNTQPVRDIRRAEDYLLERMTPLFSGAVKAGDVDADTALRCVRGFFDSLREGNSDTLLAIRLTRPVRASDMPEGNPGAVLADARRHAEQELLASEKWLKFMQGIAAADDTRRRAQASNGVPPEMSALPPDDQERRTPGQTPGRPGRPREDDRANEAVRLKGEGKSYGKIAQIQKSTPEAVRKLIKSRQPKTAGDLTPPEKNPGEND